MSSTINLERLMIEASTIFKQDIEVLFVIDSKKEANKLIKKLHDLITTLLEIIHNKKTHSDSVTVKSLNIIQSKLDSNIDIQSLQRKILQLYLVLLEKEFQIDSPPLGTFTEIRRDKPIITPANMIKASLAEQLYNQLEHEIKSPTLSLTSDLSLGRLCLWLFLKEGCVNTKDISTLLTHAYCLHRTEQFSYFSEKQQYLLSPVAETLLVLHRISFIQDTYYKLPKFSINKAKPLHYKYHLKDLKPTSQFTLTKTMPLLTSSKIIKCINEYCYYTDTIPKQYSINLSDIRLCHKIETILTQNAIDYRIQSNLLQSTPLTISVMKRVFLDKIESPKKKHHKKGIHQGSTIRQSTVWKKNIRSSHNITELNNDRLMLMLSGFLDLIKTSNNTRKEEAKHSQLIRSNFLNWLEDKENASKYPVIWVLISWMYQLIYYGSIGRKSLRFSTICDYIRTFSVPFILEFNYCNLFTMNALEWAEKLNIVAEGIHSTQRKSFVLYFADFIVSSQIVPDLCFSDLDITTSKSSVSANLITLREADTICSFLNKDNTETELALIIFLLGFYAGLRRGEIGGLQFSDFHINNLGYLQVHIRLNKYRSLKTGNSARNLPLDSLMPIHCQKKIIAYLEKSKLGSRKKNILVFQNSKQLSNAFTLLTIVLKEITQDDELRFHHLRHSFANWNWLLINFNRYPTENLPLPLQHDFFSLKRQEQLFHRLGIHNYTRKKAFALSRLLGHGAIETTFSSYIHLTSLHIYLLNICRNESPLHLLQHPNDYTVKIINPSMRPTRKGKPLALYHDALPPIWVGWHRPDIEISLRQLICKDKIHVSSYTLGMSDILKCITFLTYGRSIKQTAELTKITEDIVIQINLRLDLQRQIYTSRSKSNLPKFCGITDLNQYQKEQLNYFIQRLEQSINSKKLSDAKVDLTQVTNALRYCVGAKGHLIRTHDVRVVAFLLKMMKVIGIKGEHLRVKWYFTHERAADKYTIDNVISHYRYWEKLVHSRVGFNSTTVEAIIPHKYDRLSQKMKSIGVDVHRSNEAKFLGYHEKGNISIHLLQTKKENRNSLTKGFQKLIPMNPQRSRSYITFLQLLDVYLDIIPLALSTD